MEMHPPPSPASTMWGWGGMLPAVRQGVGWDVGWSHTAPPPQPSEDGADQRYPYVCSCFVKLLLQLFQVQVQAKRLAYTQLDVGSISSGPVPPMEDMGTT